MDGLQFVASLVSSVAWPLVVVVAIIRFEKQIGELIGRVRSVKALGTEIISDLEAKTDVALATATAAASAQAGAMIARPEADRPLLAEQLHDLANSRPRAAVLRAYEEVQRVLRGRMTQANIAKPEDMNDSDLIDVALKRGVITRETAEAIRGILVLRNAAAHGPELDAERALDYITLADAVIYSVQVVRADAGHPSGTGATFDATVKTGSQEG